MQPHTRLAPKKTKKTVPRRDAIAPLDSVDILRTNPS
jgi:hypothetical protein